MTRRSTNNTLRTIASAVIALGLVTACSGGVADAPPMGGDPDSPPNPSGGSPSVNPDNPIGPDGDPVVVGGDSEALPARIRRLTNAEYDASVQALLGTAIVPSVEFSFPPDAKQGPANSPAGAAFTLNDAQRVDPVLADKLDTAAVALAEEARANGVLDQLAPCGEGDEACARAFIESFGASAYRRVLSEDEVAGLLKAYHVGADGYTHADGVDLVVRVLLQSPGFLYLTEIGSPGASGTFAMTSDEIAASLAYLVTGGPPDADLLALAAAGELTSPEVREAEARRLMATTAGRERFVRVVREWLGIVDVARRDKSQSVYPEFAGVSQAMEQESRDFIDEVLTNSTGTLEELLTADWTIVDGGLAGVYGVSAAGQGERTSLAGVNRRGILQQAAFLSVFASNNASHPVFRGVALMRRIACLEVPDPGALGIVVSFPAADMTKTTRGRFEAHVMDEGCAGCHASIDSFGFAFENFDGMGKERSMDNGLPIDTQITLNIGSEIDGSYAGAAELVDALASSESVKSCLARQIFRSSAGRSDASIKLTEDAFVETWKGLPEEQQGRLADVLVAFIKSPVFVQRIAP